MLNLFFNPVSSLRGASPRTGAGSSQNAGQWNIVPAHQVQESEGVLPADVVELVVDDFWAKYDDLRWAFFRETR
jgi:U3 small nucleolar RNA-associated protein 19